MILSDADIEARLASRDIAMDPSPDESQMQPASIDLRLAKHYCRMTSRPRVLDVTEEDTGADHHVATDRIELFPGEFVLATTHEYIMLPPDLVGQIDGRSSVGRMGIMIHVTAGYIDPGYQGRITLEVFNVSPRIIILRPGMRICQISFQPTATPPNRVYDGKYQGDFYATPSRILKDWEKEKNPGG